MTFNVISIKKELKEKKILVTYLIVDDPMK